MVFQVYFKATGDTPDNEHGALTVDAVQDAFQFENDLTSIDVQGVGNWTAVCKTLFPGVCLRTGITRFWAWTPGLFEQSVQGNQTKLLADVSSGYYYDGGQVCWLRIRNLGVYLKSMQDNHFPVKCLTFMPLGTKNLS